MDEADKAVVGAPRRAVPVLDDTFPVKPRKHASIKLEGSEWYDEEAVDVHTLLNSLQVTETDLEHVVWTQPAMLKAALAYRIQKLRSANEARAALTQAERDAELRIRLEGKASNAGKFTEAHVAALVKLDPKVILLTQQNTRAEESEEAAKQLMEAVRARGSAAKVYVELLGVLVAFGGKQLAEQQATSKLKRLHEQVSAKYEAEDR